MRSPVTDATNINHYTASIMNMKHKPTYLSRTSYKGNLERIRIENDCNKILIWFYIIFQDYLVYIKKYITTTVFFSVLLHSYWVDEWFLTSHLHLTLFQTLTPFPIFTNTVHQSSLPFLTILFNHHFQSKQSLRVISHSAARLQQ